VVADELPDHGAARGILRDGAEDVLAQPRGLVDAEVLREINIRATVLRHHAHERQVGDILHRRECEDRRAGALEQTTHAIANGFNTCADFVGTVAFTRTPSSS